MSGRTLLALIGANIMGSLSPALFADAFAAAGIEGFYHLMDVERLRERRLARLLDAIRIAGFAGANITYPFKQEVIALLDSVDPEAAQIGAVNTIAIAPDGRTTGYNRACSARGIERRCLTDPDIGLFSCHRSRRIRSGGDLTPDYVDVTAEIVQLVRKS